MPSLSSSPGRNVGFAPVPATYSRLPHDDELYVMRAFARHASHCPTCAHPYDVHKRGGSLCSKGHQRGLDVAQYVVNRCGQAFSVVDLEGNHRVQMEIPADCGSVRELLKAMERGLRLRRKVQPISYDATYPVPPRVLPQHLHHHHHHQYQPEEQQQQRYEQREPRYIRKPSLETAMPPPGHHLARQQSKHGKPTTYSGRGSLYDDDMRERAKMQQHQQQRKSTYYSVGSRGVLPVPAKDDWF